MTSNLPETSPGAAHPPASPIPATAASGGKAQTRVLALVGLDTDLENRVKAACWRLSGQGHDVRLQAWSGVHCDLLIVGSTESHARVLEAARERRVPMLRFVTLPVGQAPAANEISAGSSVEQILRRLQGQLDPYAAAARRPSGGKAERPSGLLWLMIERRPTSAAIHAVSESYEIWIVPERALVCARTHSDVIGARERVLSPHWIFQRVRAARVPDGPTLGIDEFFLDACMRVSHRLPFFASGSYRLRRQPAITSAEPVAEIVALAAQFGARDEVSSADLAALADVGQHHANAFLWATLASGALESRSGRSGYDGPPQTLFERMRASFGLGRR
ncbi:MAG: hypothetical protein ABI846_00380 [Rudaea sp.]